MGGGRETQVLAVATAADDELHLCLSRTDSLPPRAGVVSDFLRAAILYEYSVTMTFYSKPLNPI